MRSWGTNRPFGPDGVLRYSTEFLGEFKQVFPCTSIPSDKHVGSIAFCVLPTCILNSIEHGHPPRHGCLHTAPSTRGPQAVSLAYNSVTWTDSDSEELPHMPQWFTSFSEPGRQIIFRIQNKIPIICEVHQLFSTFFVSLFFFFK